MIDRIAPTQRPARRSAGYQNWRSLLFLHWRVPKEMLRAVVPKPLSLDLFDGEAYVGVVPFAMQNVRPRWWRQSWALAFLEANVRTYVHYQNQPGVYFLSLDAASRLAVRTARAVWGLPYYLAEMHLERSGDEITYQTQRAGGGPRHHVRYRIGEHLGPSAPDTIEHFLLERYLLFVERRGNVKVGQVHHTPYPAQTAHILELEDNLVAAVGLPAIDEPPHLVHYAAGVDVEVFSLQRRMT